MIEATFFSRILVIISSVILNRFMFKNEHQVFTNSAISLGNTNEKSSIAATSDHLLIQSSCSERPLS